MPRMPPRDDRTISSGDAANAPTVESVSNYLVIARLIRDSGKRTHPSLMSFKTVANAVEDALRLFIAEYGADIVGDVKSRGHQAVADVTMDDDLYRVLALPSST
jgi:hypothetical protein